MQTLPILRLSNGREIIHYTAEYIEARLIEAAKVLLNSQIPTRPSMNCSSWPDYPHDFDDMYGWHEVEERRPRPTKAQATRATETLGWLALIPDDKERKAVQWRMFLSPKTQEPRSWYWLGKKLHSDPKTAAKRVEYGLRAIADALNRKQ